MTIKQNFFDKDIRLPSPPVIALKILEAVRDENNSFDELAKIISVDPALSIRILNIANSVLYGLPKPVKSLSQATALIGTNTLKNIALSFVIVQEFQDPGQGSFNLDLFWRRALTTAVAAEVLVESISSLKEDDIFVSALLQDIGVLILFLSNPDTYNMVLDEKRIGKKSLCQIEKEQFKHDHTEIGHYFLNAWGLPDSICEPILNHHAEHLDKSSNQAGIVLGVAAKISSIYHGKHSNRSSMTVRSVMAQTWDFPKEQVNALIDTIGEKASEVMELFSIDPGEIKPFSLIMQEAIDELGRLNLSYEEIVIELKQAKLNAEQLSLELKKSNDSLRNLAFRDGLTGLYNHRYFQETLESELKRASRYKHPISLLLMDIDFFKTVNDNHGHPAGDHVLKEVSRVIVNLVRKCDTVARYGGEEFTVILPESGITGAKILAQRLRRGIEQEQFEYNGKKIPITISIGLATVEISKEEINRNLLIEQSDQLLYKAKQNGRNRVESGVV